MNVTNDMQKEIFFTWNRRQSWAIVIILSLAFIVRVAGVNTEGLWLDEIMEIHTSLCSSLSDVRARIPGDKPPLVYLELYVLTKTGLSEILLRLPSVFAGVILVGLTMALARLLYPYNPTTYLAAGVLIAFSPLSVKLSREILPYSQAGACVAMVYYSGLCWWRGGRWYWLAWSCLFASLSVWFAFQSFAPLAALGLASVFGVKIHSKNHSNYWLRPALLAGILIMSAASTIPLLSGLWAKLSDKPPWTAPPLNWSTLGFFLQKLSAGYDGSKPNSIWILFIVFALGEVLCILFRQENFISRLVFLFWLFGGLILLYGLARFQKHWIASRYLIFFISPLIIFVAGFSCRIPTFLWRQQSGRLVSYGLIVLLIVGSMPTLVSSYHSRPDFRGLAIQLAEQALPNDLVLFQHAYDEYCYAYYQMHRINDAPVSTYYQKTFPDDICPDFMERVARSKRLWIPEHVYDAYPVRPEVRAFFVGDHFNVAQGEPIPFHIETPENCLEILAPEFQPTTNRTTGF